MSSEIQQDDLDLQVAASNQANIENIPAENNPIFGVLVIGPSGSGKSTLCEGLQQFMDSVRRPSCVINLDPANESAMYRTGIDIQELIKLDEVMENLNLGYAFFSLDQMAA